MASIEIINNKQSLALKEMPKLAFTLDNNGMVKYGKNNLYPQELVRLYNDHPEHRAIINRKARYIWGKGLKAVKPEDEIKVNAFVDGFNKKETLNQVGKKISVNTEMFNGQFIEVITNLAGVPIEMFFLNSANCRLSECGEILYFCKDWKKSQSQREVKEIKKFKEGENQIGSFFCEFKYYSATGCKLDAIYPTAQYQSIVEDINTDITISVTNSNMVNNGLSMGKIINFFNGKPDDKTTAVIDRGFKGTYTGEEGEAVMIVHSDRDDKAPELVDVTPTDMADRFTYTAKRAQKKIFAGHEMASELFNIKFDDSFLSGSPDLLTLQELFVKGYVEPRQEDLLEFLSYLSFIKTGEYLEMMFEPISLIGADLSNDIDLTQDERRKLKGYEPLTAPKLDELGQPLPVQATEVNDNLKGLSASENRDMQRIIRDFVAGKNGMNEHLAIARLTAYGLSTNDAKKMLGINTGIDAKMSSQVDKILLALEACAEDDNDDDIILVEAAHIHNSKDALKYERNLMKFADALVISVEELDNAILTALKGNPTLTIDELAATLKYDAIKISEGVARLTKNGFLTDTIDGFKPTQKAIDKPTEPIVSREVYTVYKYMLRDDAQKLVKGGSSRKFCIDMMRISKTKSWTFEALDSISIDGMENVGGTNIWDYKGGYTTVPNTNGELVNPECRHAFYAITKTRKKK
jgi:hypothetical protein